MHLKTAHEFFQYLSNLFEMKKDDVTQREAMRNPRTHAGTHQKCNGGSHKAQDCETATNKPKSTKVEESRNRTASLIKPTSSRGGECRDVGTRHAHDTPPKPQPARRAASEAAADTVNPNATSAGPTGSAGASCKPQDALHEIADDSARGQGEEANEGVEGEGKTPNDNGGDEDVYHTHVAPNETPPNALKPTPHDRMPHDERSSGEGQGVAGSECEARDNDEEARRAETPMHKTTAPPSMPLEGERNSQATSGDTRAHSEGAEPPDGTADAQEGAQTQRHMNSTHAGQQHSASVHGEGRCVWAERCTSTHEWNGCTRSSDAQVPDRIPEDPGGHAKPSNTPDRPPSTSLEGERGHEPSSSHADHECRNEPEVKLEGGRTHTSTAPPNASAMVEHAHANAPSMLIEGEEVRARERAQSAMKMNEDDQHNPKVNEDLPRAPPEPPPPILYH
ncbi:hypothetical protein BU15DRAFT_82861 [Melanogaster broomeanus]|nr:hypothetical protein BU15DRAFT_82861 [Melanogaster broomeanus]